MYDELLKRLKTSVDGRYEKCDGCPYEEDYPCCVDCLDKMHKQAADAIEELSRDLDSMNEANIALYGALPRWIPVAEMLPEAGERVLCYCRANIYEVMKMRTDGDWVYDTNHIYMHSFVTHWMPLPEPPKEE